MQSMSIKKVRLDLTNAGGKNDAKNYFMTLIVSDDEAEEFIRVNKVFTNLKQYKNLVIDIYI